MRICHSSEQLVDKDSHREKKLKIQEVERARRAPKKGRKNVCAQPVKQEITLEITLLRGEWIISDRNRNSEAC